MSTTLHLGLFLTGNVGFAVAVRGLTGVLEGGPILGVLLGWVQHHCHWLLKPYLDPCIVPENS